MIHRSDTLDLNDVDSIINQGNELSSKLIGIPRASSIDKACMRMHVLLSKSNIPKKEYLGFGDRLTFAWGDAFHIMAQNTNVVLKAQYRRGWWRCMSCNTILGFGASPNKDYRCKKCNSRREAIIYHEHSMVVDDPFYLTGHPDMFVEFGQKGLLTITEFKTMAGHMFKKLDKPLAEHVCQITSYMMGGDKDVSTLKIPPMYKINTEYAIIIYITKEAIAKGTKPFKAFRVRRNKIFEGMLLEKLQAFKMGYENYPNNIPEPESLCSHNKFQSSISKDCPALAQCQKLYFDGK